MADHKQPKGLGKGLSALFGEDPADTRPVTGLKVRDIEPSPNQPRHVFDEQALNELADSIRQNGVITPITVRRDGDIYRIIAGERRWRASRLAGLDEIPAHILDVDEATAYALALIENLQREDLDPIEEAEGYRTLMEQYDMTQEQAAERVGKSRPAVANPLRLLNLPAPLRDKVSRGQLSAGHGRALLSLGDPEQMEKAAEKVVAQGMSVRETEKLTQKLQKPKKAGSRPSSDDAMYIEDLQRRLSAQTGYKVTIQHGPKKGRLSIEYYGNDGLEALCQALRSLKPNME